MISNSILIIFLFVPHPNRILKSEWHHEEQETNSPEVLHQTGKPQRLVYTVFAPFYQFTKIYHKETTLVERLFH